MISLSVYTEVIWNYPLTKGWQMQNIFFVILAKDAILL